MILRRLARRAQTRRERVTDAAQRLIRAPPDASAWVSCSARRPRSSTAGTTSFDDAATMLPRDRTVLQLGEARDRLHKRSSPRECRASSRSCGSTRHSPTGGSAGSASRSRCSASPARRSRMRSRRVCEVGLWAWSRHRNYFFEWCVWVGYAVYGIALARSASSRCSVRRSFSERLSALRAFPFLPTHPAMPCLRSWGGRSANHATTILRRARRSCGCALGPRMRNHGRPHSWTGDPSALASPYVRATTRPASSASVVRSASSNTRRCHTEPVWPIVSLPAIKSR